MKREVSMTQEKKQDFTRRISQANASALVVITYEIALENLKDAMEAETDAPEFGKALSKVKECVMSLQSALNFEYPISRNLLSLYSYVVREVTRAQAGRTKEPLDSVRNVLRSLNTAFTEVAALDHSEALMENTQNVYAGMTYGRTDINESTDMEANRGFFA